MLDFVSSGDLHWKRFWLFLQHEVETYHVRSSESEHVFRPGELAHAKGVVIEDFYNFLEQRGYSLTDKERENHQIGLRAMKKSGKDEKPCVILDRLGNGRYRICHLSSFGGNVKPEHILNPMMRYFGFSMVKGKWPPGEKLLGISPGMSRTSYAIMIPSVTKEVTPLDWAMRSFLKAGQLERLKKLMKSRIEGFDAIQEVLRAEILNSKRASMIKKHSKAMQRLLLSPPYLREELRTTGYYIEALHPGSRLAHLIKGGASSDQHKIARVVDHKPRRLFVPPSNFIQHFHRRTVTEVIGRDIPLFQQLRNIDARKFRLPRMRKFLGQEVIFSRLDNRKARFGFNLAAVDLTPHTPDIRIFRSRP